MWCRQADHKRAHYHYYHCTTRSLSLLLVIRPDGTAVVDTLSRHACFTCSAAAAARRLRLETFCANTLSNGPKLAALSVFFDFRKERSPSFLTRVATFGGHSWKVDASIR